jgi:hypothetical protein
VTDDMFIKPYNLLAAFIASVSGVGILRIKYEHRYGYIFMAIY